MPLHDLSFARRRDDGTVDPWVVSPTGDYATDCDLGRSAFNELRHAALRDDDWLMVLRVLQAIVRKGGETGIEDGFHQALAENVS